MEADAESQTSRRLPFKEEGFVVRLNGDEPVKPDPDIARLEQRLAERLGSAVQIRHGKKGKGQLVIGYNSLDELQGVLAHIR